MPSPWRSAVARAVREAGPLGDGIHVWGAHLERFAPHYGEALALLSFTEIQRAMRFRSAVECDRYILAHAIVRLVLAEYAGCDPTELGFQRGIHGKPYLANDAGLHFNLSHAGEFLALAVTRSGDVGIDVEPEREVDGLDALARSVMSAAEYGALISFPAQHRSRSFLEHWTRKEAVAKARGTGLGASTEPEPDWKCHAIEWEHCVTTLATRNSSPPLTARL